MPATGGVPGPGDAIVAFALIPGGTVVVCKLGRLDGAADGADTGGTDVACALSAPRVGGSSELLNERRLRVIMSRLEFATRLASFNCVRGVETSEAGAMASIAVGGARPAAAVTSGAVVWAASAAASSASFRLIFSASFKLTL